MSKQKYCWKCQKMSSLHYLTGLMIGMILMSTAGCHKQSALEMDYGQSWAFNEEVQIANPRAAFTETPATGLPPNASTTIMNGYNKSFERKKAGGGGTTMINLGGLTTAPGSGGGGGGADSQ